MNQIFILSTVISFCLIPSLFAQEQKPQPEKFELTSPQLEPNTDMPPKYTCKGGDINPPLEIKNLPRKTKTLALTIHDPDAQEGPWVHWVVYNIPPTKTTIPENSIPGYQALNDFGKFNYSGPCPSDEKSHRYIFRAYAVDTFLLINEGMTMKDLEKAMNGHILAKSELISQYRKPIW